jgi:Spy/CpxP family protein refolding chaperone
VSVASPATNWLARWPDRRVLLALLVISVVLNVFVVAGAVWSRMWPPPGPLEQRFQHIATQLDLDDKQRAAFRKYVSGSRARGDKIREQVAPLISGAWDEIAKPQADAGQVSRLFDEAAAKRQELQHDATTQTLELLALLSPEQRRKFVAIMRERRATRRNR